jgi:predicted acylesterase/phospholipase RssA
MEKQENNILFENLAFNGGGVRGLAYIGALKAMNELDRTKDIKKAIGTSVGSIFALIICCKCTNDDIDKYSQKFFDTMTKFHDNIFIRGYNLLEHNGLHNNENIYDAVNDLLVEKFNIKNMTLKQLFDITNIELTVVGTCLTTRSIVYFNYMAYPDMEVAKSIQISAAIPYFYISVMWDEKYWVHGGIADNFAINYYDSPTGTYNNKTIGLLLEPNGGKKQTYDVKNYKEITEGIEDTEIANNVDRELTHEQYRNIIKIDTGNISFVDFNISDADKQFLITNGYNSTMNFFNQLMNKPLISTTPIVLPTPITKSYATCVKDWWYGSV